MKLLFTLILNVVLILVSVGIFVAIEYELGKNIKVGSLDALKKYQMQKCEINDNLFIRYIDFNCSGECKKYCEYRFITHSAGVGDDKNLKPIHNLLDKESMNCAMMSISRDNKTESIGTFYDCFRFDSFSTYYERFTFVDIMVFVFVLLTLIVVMNLIIFLKNKMI